MYPSSHRRTPALRHLLHRVLRALLVGLALISLSGTSFAFDVYRGLRIHDGKLDLSSNEFQFNPDLSLFNSATLTPPAYPCYLRVVLDAQPANPGDSSSAVDFAGYSVRFDNVPPGHYSMLAKANVNNGRRISDTLKLMKSRKPGEYDMLIVDGQLNACFDMDAHF